MRSRIYGPVAVASLLASAWCASGVRAGTANTITMQVLVTGYVDRGYTASGIYTHPGTCAVDPRVIPLGTYITIDGLWTCHAEDTGGAVIGYHVDVWVPTTAEAYAITGYRMATWSTPSQQVLGYHATNPTVIPTPTINAPPTRYVPPVPSPTSDAPPAFTATPAAPPASPTPDAASPARGGYTRLYATPTPASGTGYSYSTAPTATATPVPYGNAGTTSSYSTPTVVPTYAPSTDGSSQPPQTSVPSAARGRGCHKVYWTQYSGGVAYHYWRIVCG